MASTDPSSPANLSRRCVQQAGVVRLTKATLDGMSFPRLQAIASCDDLTPRERRTVESLIAGRPMRAYVSTGAVGPAPVAA